MEITDETPEVFRAVRAILRPEHFFDDSARWVYRQMLQADDQGQPWTPEFLIVLAKHEQREGHLQPSESEDIQRLVVEAAGSTSLPAAAPYLAQRIVAMSYRRELLSRVFQAAQDLYRAPPTATPEELAGIVERLLRAPVGERLLADLPHLSQAVAEWLEERQPKQWPTGISVELDRYLQGLQPGRLVLVAARTGRGKTSALLQMCWSAAAAGAKVYFASYEMSGPDLVARMVAQRTQLPVGAVRRRNLLEDDRARVDEDVKHLSSLPLYLDCAPPPHVEDLVARVQGRELDVVFVDYLQLMGSRSWVDGRWREVGVITTELKALAKRRNLCVVAAAQLSRAAQARMLSSDPEDRRPELSDLRESGNLEQDADVVLFLWPYTRDLAKQKLDYRITIAKNRHGIANYDIPVIFDTMTQAFFERQQDEKA